MPPPNQQLSTPLSAETVERALILQDLSGMNPVERLTYYKSVCESLGLNPLTRPFAYISLNGKLTLYALKDCTEQLRKIHSVSIEIVSREAVEGVYTVTARASNKDGRKDESIGAVAFENLKGDARANALMKAETKAKRRVTLSFCGLGMLDEMEVDDVTAPPIAATVEHPSLPQSSDPIYDWKNVNVHFGDRHGPGCDDEHPHGRQLGELSDAALQWFQNKWSPRPGPDGQISAADARLRRALDISLGKEKPDVRPQEQTATQPELVSAEIPAAAKTVSDAAAPAKEDGPPA